jgi:hypothetical protein
MRYNAFGTPNLRTDTHAIIHQHCLFPKAFAYETDLVDLLHGIQRRARPCVTGESRLCVVGNNERPLCIFSILRSQRAKKNRTTRRTSLLVPDNFASRFPSIRTRALCHRSLSECAEPVRSMSARSPCRDVSTRTNSVVACDPNCAARRTVGTCGQRSVARCRPHCRQANEGILSVRASLW